MTRRLGSLQYAALAVVLVALALALGGGAAGAQTEDEPAWAVPVKTLEEAVTSGRIRKETVEAVRKAGNAAVIVKVKLPSPFRPEGTLTNTQVEAQRQAIAKAQDAVLAKIAGQKVSALKRFRTIPSMALAADEATLTALVALPEVARISVDWIDAPHLGASTQVIGSANVRDALGNAGAGATVAILDTGVDKNHPFLAGKVVSEACFSGPNLYASNLCPGGSSSTATGSGVPCVINVCDHGTHVAGIAAGKRFSNATTSVGFDGVAPEATIISIQVFSYFSGDSCAQVGLPSPCPLSPASNQIEALERVLALRNTFRIAAANLSLGAGAFTSQQTCDDFNSDQKDIIDNLRSVQIATVISAGNGAQVPLPGGGTAFQPGLAAPACISSAISVGATTNANVVVAFSQAAPFLSLLAPGNNINSSVAGGGFGIKSGTSMAAPHVTGAFAVLRSLRPALGVSDILTTLTTTGLPVTDNRSGTPIVTPRLRLDGAVEAQTGAPLRPTSLRVVRVTGTSIQVAWDDNALGEQQFRLTAVPALSGAPVGSATAPQNATAGTVTGLAPNQSYTVTVRACDGFTTSANCSPASNAVQERTLNTLPSAPTNLRAGSITSSSATLTWDVNSPNTITRFEFRHALTGASATQCPTLALSFPVSSGTFSQSCSGLSAGTTYQFQVRACNGPGEWHCSGWSNIATVTTPAQGTVPNAPSNLRVCSGLTITAPCQSPVTLLWNDNSSNETRFEFEWAVASTAYTGPPASWPASAWNRVSLGPNVTSYRLSSVTSGTLYYFRVRACDQDVCSAYSNIASWTAP